VLASWARVEFPGLKEKHSAPETSAQVVVGIDLQGAVVGVQLMGMVDDVKVAVVVVAAVGRISCRFEKRYLSWEEQEQV